jgi:hypothetical protein
MTADVKIFHDVNPSGSMPVTTCRSRQARSIEKSVLPRESYHVDFDQFRLFAEIVRKRVVLPNRSVAKLRSALPT